MDVHSKETRSYNMSRVKNKATKPEELVRKFLHKNGFRYRKNVKELPGCPDIVLRKYGCVVFINGCFWHMHSNCKKASLPKSNTDFWIKKLSENKDRDIKNHKVLVNMGWNVIIVWECELKKDNREKRLRDLVLQISSCKNSSE